MYNIQRYKPRADKKEHELQYIVCTNDILLIFCSQILLIIKIRFGLSEYIICVLKGIYRGKYNT